MKRREFSKMAAAGFFGIGLAPVMAAGAETLGLKRKKGDSPIDIGSRRELFLDHLIVDQLKGESRRVFHEPVPQEIVMTLDKPWEGNASSYVTVFQDGDLYRMYYRASGYDIYNNQTRSTGVGGICYAESRDGINWIRPNLGLVSFAGSLENNIVIKGDGTRSLVVFKDENPNYPSHYKAVGVRKSVPELLAYVSSDGIHWELIREDGIIKDGAFDSQNLAFWDPNIKAYRAYYRFYKFSSRDIKTSISPDFFRWKEEGTELDHIKIAPAQFYTNVIRPYYRAPHIYLGMPGMYHDRGWTYALEQLPDLERRKLESGVSMRSGTALTDTLLMWSRDGVSFERSSCTFVPPGPERSGSWMYGNHFMGWHLVETASDFQGAAPELSLYAVEFYRKGPAVKLRRYIMRLDGFASIHTPFAGGEMITLPILFEGSHLSLNFATSASGFVQVEILDEYGKPIPGFSLDDSYELYGDTVDRIAKWKGDPNLGALSGKPICLRFVLKDSDLYSFKFEENLF